MHPLKSDDDLIVYLDVKSPYAYLAKDLTRNLKTEFNISIDWRPLTLNIPSFLGSAKADDTGKVVESKRTPRQWEGVRYAYMDAKRYARLRDIKIYGPRKIWDTRLIHTAFLYVKLEHLDKLMDFLDLVYYRFWLRALDVESTEVVNGVLSELGLLAHPKQFDDYVAGEGGKLHDDLMSTLHPNGVFGVPTYVVDGEVYFGREHLPRVKWHLGGCVGTSPDVAYESEDVL